jgi:16S rRNA (uracil1498-N3)-methyltransferase
MKRFFIDPEEILKSTPAIGGQDAQHIKRVLRLKSGDPIVLLDGTGFEYIAKIVNFSKDRVHISIVEKISPETESPLQLIVLQGYLKDKKMDILVRHLTEIGVTKWIPVISERSVPHPDKNRMTSRMKRWETIANEAVKQCRRPIPPEICKPLLFDEAVSKNSDVDLKIIFFENETIPLTKSLADPAKNPSKIMIMLGPEGGFSQKEVEMAKNNGFISASMGPRILKAETASISACTLVQYLFGDMG